MGKHRNSTRKKLNAKYKEKNKRGPSQVRQNTETTRVKGLTRIEFVFVGLTRVNPGEQNEENVECELKRKTLEPR